MSREKNDSEATSAGLLEHDSQNEVTEKYCFNHLKNNVFEYISKTVLEYVYMSSASEFIRMFQFLDIFQSLTHLLQTKKLFL